MADREEGSFDTYATASGYPVENPTSGHSSCTTLSGSTRPSIGKYDSACDLDLEARVKPSLHHEFDLKQDMEALQTTSLSDELPEPKPLSWTRYAIFNVYRRLFSLVFLGNLAAFIYYMISYRSPLDLVNASAANILAVGLARQPVVVNAMFRLFSAVPRSMPLRLRRLAAKIYCYGGVHSGCGIASMFWYIGFIVMLTCDVKTSSESSFATPAITVVAYMVLVLLVAIIVAAYPKIRFMLHDYFELTHRFCGWAVVALFWPLLVLASIRGAQAKGESLGDFVIRFPTFWMLIITTLAILHPWVLLRRIKVTPETLSSHAIRLHFHHTTIDFGQGIQLSKHPFRDWHSFATFPDIPSLPGTNGSVCKADGFSSLISKAGDWTSDTIANPPTHLWKRGIPIYGFVYATRLFSRLIVVTTGSGIGPCLSFLGDPNRPAMRVVWQTKSPLKTYGQNVFDIVHQLDANPTVLDTTETGRQDMLPLVIRLAKDFEAEAVCVISNPLVTRRLVFECESRGVPAFGPIFDS